MCYTRSEFFEFQDGDNVTRFRGWLLHTEDVKVSEQEQTDYGYSALITVRVFRVDGGQIHQSDPQEAGITRTAWAICIVEYRSDGKFDDRPVGLRREFELNVKLFADREALTTWSSREGLQLSL